MKKSVATVWGSMLVLALIPAWGAPLSAQTGIEVRELQAQMRQAVQEEQAARQAYLEQLHATVGERVAQEREYQAQVLQEQLARVRELRQERTQEGRMREQEARSRALEHAMQSRARSEEARERAQRAAERAQQVMVQIRSRARIGVSLDFRQGREYDQQGALVKGVMDESPAEEAGIQEGDIITHLDGHNLLDPLPGDEEEELDEYESLPVQRLMALARELEDGQEVEVRYLRDGNGERVTLEAAELDDTWTTFGSGEFPRGIVMRVDPEEGRSWTFRMPEHDEWSRSFEDLEDLHIDVPEIHIEGLGEGWNPGGRGIQIFRGGDRTAWSLSGVFSQGLSLRTLTPELGEYFSTDTGVLVMDVDEDSGLGLLPGDVILSIDGRDVEDQGDVIRILRSYEDGEAVAFRIMRHGQETRIQGTAG